MDLSEIADLIRTHPGLTGKAPLAAVADTIGGDGDDAAILADDALALAAEAISPAFLARDPRAAGIAGALTVVSDLIASGAEPLALLDTVVATETAGLASVLDGLRTGATLVRVPVVGGHTTIDEAGPGLSTFALGRVVAPLRAAAARPGDTVSLVTCLEGQAFAGGDGQLFFSHLRGPRRERLRDDLDLVLAAAAAGEAWAARDVSMPGLAGSLLQLLESAGGRGCTLDLTALPVPDGMDLERWLVSFPSYGFLLAGDARALERRFTAAGLTCHPLGTLDGSGCLRIAVGSAVETVWDLDTHPLTGLGPPA